ncbi:hypothetical protein [Paenibacillus protaetiae]|uniref:DUF4367 domain-containing protein n=1 Tax=Paenibacillus protaetiae TaxID=2509456 RepID=A0A4P6F1E5_9BACL|nr:hypothetical protein [Paenibacillus protaetiae]QAY66857.1 hypothetical protein ET464_11085 [Paenibacillus protaetiae]
MANQPDDWTEREQTGLPSAEKGTSEAWAKLQLKLNSEEASPVWAEWSRQGITAQDTELLAAGAAQLQGELYEPHKAAFASAEQLKTIRSASASRRWLNKYGVKTGVAAAAVLICAVIAIPSTNDALASILGKFKMNQVAVVQEDDFNTVLQSFFGSDESAESVNKYGEFERTVSGEAYPELTAAQAYEQYGIRVPEKLETPLGEQTELRIHGQQAEALTFRLNVDAVNTVMKKLGAAKLLPASVDGKPISLRIGSGVYAEYQFAEAADVNHYVGVSYMPVPVLDMDPSIDAKDAYEALIRFPVMPDNLKSVLMKSTRISEGELPLPLVVGGHVTKTELKGADVYFENNDSWRGWSATWLERGVIKQVSMYDVKTREDAETIVKELIGV